MISLFIDTSNSDVSISVVRDGSVLSLINSSIPNEHSIYTVYYLKKILDDCSISPNDVSDIIVVNGPGSFTGIRIGLTIAKVYAYMLNLDIRVISSLKEMALSCSGDYILTLVDAKHDNYYIGLYDREYNCVVDEHFGNKHEVIELINEYNPVLVGASDIVIDNINVPKFKINVSSIVAYCLKQEPLNVHSVVPNYLKLPQVMEKKND